MNIEINNLSKAFGEKKILDNINLRIEKSKITVLLGANGAGKTSLLRAALGLTKFEKGKIKLDNEDLLNYSLTKRASKIGYLAQTINPEWNMKTQDLIELGRMPIQNLGQTNKAKDKIAIMAAMERLGIAHLYGKNIHEISGGEVSLCLIARVLAGEPEYIFADEPFNSLDIKHQLILFNLLKDFAQNGGGALIVAHDIEMAARLGDEFVLMKDGTIIDAGAKHKVLSDENLALAYDTKIGLREINGQSVLITI